MLDIRDEHLAFFADVKKTFLKNTKIPGEDNWRQMTEDDIWFCMVEQVIATGSSRPASKFHENVNLQSLISYGELMRLGDEREVIKRVHLVLRAVGSRYARSDASKCAKTRALTHNFERLKGFSGGPRGMLESVSEFRGDDLKGRRIGFLMENFKFMGSKNARDLLMGFGLLREAVALDARLKNVFAKVGIKLPSGFESNPRLYGEVEKDILKEICEPLGILGTELDRMLYQNYDEIMKMNFKK